MRPGPLLPFSKEVLALFAQFLDFLIGGVFDFLGSFIGILPHFPMSDIKDAIDAYGAIEDVLCWVNWFLPVDIAATIITVWCTSMMAYVVAKLGFKYASMVRV